MHHLLAQIVLDFHLAHGLVVARLALLLAIGDQVVVVVHRFGNVGQLDGRLSADQLRVQAADVELGEQGRAHVVRVELVGQAVAFRLHFHRVEELLEVSERLVGQLIDLGNGSGRRTLAAHLLVERVELGIHEIAVGEADVEEQLTLDAQVELSVELLAHGHEQIDASLEHLAATIGVLLEEEQRGVQVAEVARDLAMIGHVAVELEEGARLVEYELRFEEDGARLLVVERYVRRDRLAFALVELVERLGQLEVHLAHLVDVADELRGRVGRIGHISRSTQTTLRLFEQGQRILALFVVIRIRINFAIKQLKRKKTHPASSVAVYLLVELLLTDRARGVLLVLLTQLVNDRIGAAETVSRRGEVVLAHVELRESGGVRGPLERIEDHILANRCAHQLIGRIGRIGLANGLVVAIDLPLQRELTVVSRLVALAHLAAHLRHEEQAVRVEGLECVASFRRRRRALVAPHSPVTTHEQDELGVLERRQAGGARLLALVHVVDLLDDVTTLNALLVARPRRPHEDELVEAAEHQVEQKRVVGQAMRVERGRVAAAAAAAAASRCGRGRERVELAHNGGDHLLAGLDLLGLDQVLGHVELEQLGDYERARTRLELVTTHGLQLGAKVAHKHGCLVARCRCRCLLAVVAVCQCVQTERVELGERLLEKLACRVLGLVRLFLGVRLALHVVQLEVFVVASAQSLRALFRSHFTHLPQKVSNRIIQKLLRCLCEIAGEDAYSSLFVANIQTNK